MLSILRIFCESKCAFISFLRLEEIVAIRILPHYWRCLGFLFASAHAPTVAHEPAEPAEPATDDSRRAMGDAASAQMIQVFAKLTSQRVLFKEF